MGYKSQEMYETQEKFFDATLKLLRPLVRMLLRVGVSHSEFSEIARRAFVESAFDDFRINNKKQTVSRVATLTGLSRKEALRLLDSRARPGTKEPRPVNRARRVVNGWLTDPEFNATGLVLPMYGATGSFAALVKRHSGDIPCGAIADELIRTSVAKRRGEEIELNALGYIPLGEMSEKIGIMGDSVHDLLNTFDHNLNLSDSKKPRFQRSVVYHNLPDDVAAEFEAFSDAKAAELLTELNQWLASRKQKLSRYDYGTRRVGVGVYYFESGATAEESRHD